MAKSAFELTRRELFKSAAVLINAEGVLLSSVASVRSETPTGTVEVDLRRPRDLLILKFVFQNAVWRGRETSSPHIARLHKAQPIIASIYLPSQHVDEQAFLETIAREPPGAIPVWSAAAGRTRLCFEIPDLRLRVSSQHLLNWDRWVPRVVDDIVDPGSVEAPNELVSAIELPSRLIISASSTDRWSHSRTPVARKGRTEVWHTRLTGAIGQKPRIRAVWSPDYVADAAGNPPPAEPVDTPLDARDRNGFVHSTHVAGYDPEAIEIRNLALSSAGGWLNFEKRWQESATRLGYPISWKQRTSLARDTFVEVDRLAYLYPLGFKVSVVKTSERRAQDAPQVGQAAFLRTHYTIKFEEPWHEYDDYRFPFARITPANPETPYLDFPTSFPMGGGDVSDWRDGAFWPTVGGSPYEFEFTSTDVNGRQTHFTAPLICVPTMNRASGAPDTRLAFVQAEYLRDSGRCTRPFFGQSVGFSVEKTPLTTSHPVQQLAFNGYIRADASAYPLETSFLPVCDAAQITSSAAVALGGASAAAAAWFSPKDPATTPTEVYLLRDQARRGEIEISFVGRSDKAGGVAAPKIIVGGFSRQNGPFGISGTPAALAAAPPAFLSDKFDPGEFFHPDASIFHVKLASVLNAATSGAASAAPKILSVLSANADELPSLTQSFDWVTESLRDAPKIGIVEPILLTQQGSPDQVLDPNTPSRFTLTASASLNFDPDHPLEVEAYGRLTNFSVQLAVDIGGAPNGVLLKIAEAWFRASVGEKSEFGLDLKSARFVGPILSFIQMLQEALAPSLTHAAQMIDVSSEGVRITLPPFALPAVPLGVMDISGISIASSVSLPFVRRPPQFTFDFSTPAKPFIVAVGIFGGGGYVSLTLDTLGIQALSASFQFGGYKALDLGAIQGRAFLFGGIFFGSRRLTDGSAGSELTLTAFVHAGGEACLLSIVTVSVDFYVGLTYRSAPGQSVLYGEVTLSYDVKIGFFSVSAAVHYEHTLSGSRTSTAFLVESREFRHNEIRTVNSAAEFVSRGDWLEYQRAFAR